MEEKDLTVKQPANFLAAALHAMRKRKGNYSARIQLGIVSLG